VESEIRTQEDFCTIFFLVHYVFLFRADFRFELIRLPHFDLVEIKIQIGLEINLKRYKREIQKAL